MTMSFEDSQVSIHPEYAKQLVSKFQENIKNYHDVNLCADGQKFSAHKIVLAASCKFFNSMFTNDFKESRELEIHLDVEAKSLKILIDYIYSGFIEVNDDCVENVLRTAHYLQLIKPMELCYEYLKEKMCSKNCLGIMKLAELYNNNELKETARNYFNQHFLKVCENDELNNLSFEELSSLLKSDDVAVYSEEQIFICIKNWIKHDENKRMTYLLPLLNVVRLHLLDPKFTSEEIKPYSKIYPEILILLFEIYEAKLIPEKINVLPQHRASPPTYDEKLYIFGYSNNKALKIEVYSPDKKSWLCYMPLNINMNACGVGCFDDDKVVIVGGLHGADSSDTVHFVDLKMKTVFPLSSFPLKCHDLEVVVLTNRKTKVYAIGGQNNNRSINSTYVWDPDAQIWDMAASMLESRQLFGAVAINHKIYVAGGWKNSTTLKSVEVYDSINDKWTRCPPMNIYRRSFQLGAVDKYLYAIGGRDVDGNLIASIERFDTSSNQWTFIKELPKVFDSLKTVKFKNNSLVIIGSNDFGTEVWQYSPRNEIWTFLSKHPYSFKSIGVITAYSE